MTNVNNPFGAKTTGNFNSARYELKINKYIVVESDSTPLYLNDFVKTTGESDTNGFPICTKADAGDAVRGIVVGFDATREDENIVYREASERRVVHVCDDPYIQLEMQVNGTLSTTDIGKYANIVNNGGENVTGISKTQIDLATVSTTSRQLRIVSIVDRVKNDLGLYSKVIVIIHDHELQHGVTGSIENIWKRTGPLIEPFNAGDDVDIGTGSLTAGSINLNGGQVVDTISTDTTMGGTTPSNTTLVTQAAAKNYVDNVAQGLHWQESIKDQVNFTSAEPGSPTVGDRYINTVTGVSSVTAQSVTATYIYEWNGSDWTETIPKEGYALWDEAANLVYIFNDAGVWIPLGGTQAFIHLTDTPSSYTAVGAIYNVNGSTDGVRETEVILTEGTNTFNITKGTASLDIAAGAALDVDANLSVEAVSAINQDLTSDASPTLAGLTLSGLSIANGIVQTNGSGVLSSSVTLPDGTLATTQAPLDNSTKLATTAYVDNAISVENLWNRVTGAIDYVTPYNLADGVILGDAGIPTGVSNIFEIARETQSTILSIWTSSNTFDEQPKIQTTRTRGLLVGAQGAVQNGDEIASWVAQAYDGAGYILGAQTTFSIDGTVGANQMPTKYTLQLHNGTALNDAFTIDSAYKATFLGSIEVDNLGLNDNTISSSSGDIIFSPASKALVFGTAETSTDYQFKINGENAQLTGTWQDEDSRWTFGTSGSNTDLEFRLQGAGSGGGLLSLLYGTNPNSNMFLKAAATSIEMDFGIATTVYNINGATKITSGTFALPTGTTVNEIVTSVSGASTDDQLPTAAAVWAAVQTADGWDEVMHIDNTFTILNTENLSATITQNDTTNNPAALIINNTGTGNDITLPNSSYIKNGDLVLGGDVGLTGSRITKGWFSEISLGDNDKLQFGNANDVEIYHNATDTVIDVNNGGFVLNGSLGLTGSRVTKIWTTDIESTNYPTVGGTAIDNTFQARAPVSVPVDETSTGTQGDWSYGSGYMYHCTATDTWVRWAVATSW